MSIRPAWSQSEFQKTARFRQRNLEKQKEQEAGDNPVRTFKFYFEGNKKPLWNFKQEMVLICLFL